MFSLGVYLVYNSDVKETRCTNVNADLYMYIDSAHIYIHQLMRLYSHSCKYWKWNVTYFNHNDTGEPLGTQALT